IKAELDENRYPTGIKVSDEDLAAVRIQREKFHGDWNYTILPSALIGFQGLLRRVAQRALPATLCLAFARCARTRKTPGRAGVSLVRCPDGDAANCATATKTLPWYAHALHTTRRHLPRGRIRPVHGGRSYGRSPTSQDGHTCCTHLCTPRCLTQLCLS